MIKIVQTSAIANNECPLGKLAELRSAKAPRFGRARPTTCLKTLPKKPTANRLLTAHKARIFSFLRKRYTINNKKNSSIGPIVAVFANRLTAVKSGAFNCHLM